MISTKAAKKTFKTAIFIFRRDQRLDDNTGLLYALRHAETVYPVFVFDKKQIEPGQNKYFGHHCVQFMCESLRDLDGQLRAKGSRLTLLLGTYPAILETLIEAVKPNLICVNEDYTTYSQERDRLIAETCSRHGVEFSSFEDICLLTKEQSKQGYEGDIFFKKFTPFYNKAVLHKIRLPEACKDTNFAKAAIELAGHTVKDFGQQFYEASDKLVVKGGREEALAKLADIHKMKNYADVRDQPALKTSLLSAYNKFGCLSIREIYHTAKTVLKEKAEPFTRQLYWRDFYYFIGYYFPHVFSGPMKPSYSMIPWEDDPKKIEAWKQGKTGCPIVDAAMRQMNETGWMPNRCRMIVSNYLIKDLHVNWQIGERYFASQLVDFDPCQNNGGWQWSSGSGVDSQPYFRIFNPILQMQKFDKNCTYIKTWVPELAKVPDDDIHNWETAHKKHKVEYPKPLVVHAVAKEKLIKMYKTSFDLTAAHDSDDDAGPAKKSQYAADLSIDPKVASHQLKPMKMANDSDEEYHSNKKSGRSMKSVPKKEKTVLDKSKNQSSLDKFVIKKDKKEASLSPPLLGKRAKTNNEDRLK